MVDFLVIVWLLSIVAISVIAVKLNKIKKNKVEKDDSLKKKLITTLIISCIVSFITFIGIGTSEPISEENNVNSENVANEEIIEENIVLVNEIKYVQENLEKENEIKNKETDKKQALANIPDYSGKPYITINNNEPFFSSSDLTTTSYEKYSTLDSLGRCGVAIANISKDLMPTEDRGEIGSIKPSGWHSVRYNGIEGNYLYNRCHLIGYQLSGENANEKNLITGTRYMNVDGMLPFENMVADYVKETVNHVLYRVTPIFEDNNLLASGVLMEAKSIEDNGEGIEFNVYCYNVQPGIQIDYSSGNSSGPEYTGSSFTNSTTTSSSENNSSNNSSESVKQENNSAGKQESSNEKENSSTTEPKQEETTAPAIKNNSQTYILNTNTMKFHEPSCGSASRISAKNKSSFNGTREELISRGYTPCGNCDP